MRETVLLVELVEVAPADLDTSRADLFKDSTVSPCRLGKSDLEQGLYGRMPRWLLALVAHRRARPAQRLTDCPFGNASPTLNHLAHHHTPGRGRHRFPRRSFTSFRISLANIVSASSFLRRAFSSSSLRRRTRVAWSTPANSARHRWNVGSEIPCLRHVSVMLVPPSTSARTAKILSSRNFLFLTGASFGDSLPAGSEKGDHVPVVVMTADKRTTSMLHSAKEPRIRELARARLRRGGNANLLREALELLRASSD